MLFFYETQSATSYRKYIKIINYKTEGFFHNSQENSAYLEDFEDLSKMNTTNDDKILGSFRFSLSKKKDIFERKYINWLDYILDMISKFISFKAGFSFLTLILVNPIDKLRIFASFNNKKPSLFNETSNLIIDNWYKKNNEEPNNNNRIIINKNFSFCDKLKFLFKCCNKDKKNLIAVDNFIEEKLTINDTLENIIINDIKYNKLKERIKSINIPEEHRGNNNIQYNYLEGQLRNEFPNYEAEDIKVKIKEIIEEKNRNKIIPPTQMRPAT